jgi:hypothetical protein
MFKIIFRLLGALLIGIFISFWIIQNNTIVEQSLTKKIISLLEKEWGAKIKIKSSYLNFLTLTLQLNNGQIDYNTKSKSFWNFNYCKVSLSPIKSIFNNNLSLSIMLNDVTVKTHFKNNTYDIIPHIQNIYSSTSANIPIAPSDIYVNNFDITFYNQENIFRTVIDGSLTLLKNHIIKKRFFNWWGNFSLNNGHISNNIKIFASKITGNTNFYQENPTDPWEINFSYKTHVIFDPVNKYKLEGEINSKEKKFSFSNIYKKDFFISGFYKDETLWTNGQVDLPKLIQTIAILCDQKEITSNAQDFKGLCDFNINFNNLSSAPVGTGQIKLSNLNYKNVSCEKLAIDNIHLSLKDLSSNIYITYTPDICFSGTTLLSWDKNSYDLSISNTRTIKAFKNSENPSNNWTIAPQKLNLTAHANNLYLCTGEYNITTANNTSNKKLNYKGNYSLTPNKLTTQINTKKGEFNFSLLFSPSIHITKCEYFYKNKKIINLKTKENKLILSGTCEYSFLRSFLDRNTKNLILGNNCIFNITLDQNDLWNPKGTVSLTKGKFYIPENRNLIENVSWIYEYDVNNKKIMLNNILLKFCRGKITCPMATIRLNNRYTIDMIHAPLQIENLLVNWKRDFYGFIYGNLLLNKLPDTNIKALGTIILKKSLLKDNIFASGAQNNFYGPIGSFIPSICPIEFDIHLTSEKPIFTKTESLETSSHIDINITYNYQNNLIPSPQVTGSINLEKGSLQFLKNRLLIEYGRIQFLPNQMNDPIIDIIARNRINKYTITLQATGSLQKPTIILESTPELTEEQIIGLLLAGSENAKLQTDLFTMLEQNLHDIILGSHAKLPKATNFFEKIVKPLRYVQITPDFTDQSGRGGIRGTVSVNLNDQVKAQIQKNFTLQEDLSAQVEYNLSDDVTIKGIKDQRGELGAEVEVRFKL